MKIINFRAFLLVFGAAAAGILCSLVVCFALPLGVALLVTLLTGLAAAGLRAGLKKDFYRLAAFAIALSVAILLVVSFFVTLETRYKVRNGSEHALSGRVTEHAVCDEDHGIFYVTLDELQIDGTPAGGRLSLSVFNAGAAYRVVGCGYRLALRTELYRSQLIDESGVRADYIRSDEIYKASCDAADVFGIAPGAPRPLESARLTLRERLTENMGEDAGLVAFGMIAGDKYLLDDEITAAYSTAGIGHILAVSGLHIGLIACLLCALLRRLPLPRNVSRGLVTLLLLSYVIFTGGSPSSVRAFVMCVVGVWAPAFGKRDGLNCLCLAATVCLCVSPFYLFECGYLISVAAMFGLIAFAEPLGGALTRLRLPRRPANAIAASLAVQLTTSPVTAYFFHRFYFWSFFVNAFGLAALAAFFTVFAVCLPFALIPPLGFLLVPCGFVIGALTEFCFFVSSLPLAASVWQVSAAIFLLVPLAFGLSRFVILPRKRAANILLLGMCAVVAVAAENSVKADDALLAAGGNLATTVIYDGGNRYLFGIISKRTIRELDDGRVGGETLIVYVDMLTDETAAHIVKLAALRPVKEVRLPVSGALSGVKRLVAAGIGVSRTDYNDGKCTYLYDGGVFAGWLYNSPSGRTAYVTPGTALNAACAAADVVRCVVTAKYYDPAPLYLTADARDFKQTATGENNSMLYDFGRGVAEKV